MLPKLSQSETLPNLYNIFFNPNIFRSLKPCKLKPCKTLTFYRVILVQFPYITFKNIVSNIIL